jgi:hypothetical protein
VINVLDRHPNVELVGANRSKIHRMDASFVISGHDLGREPLSTIAGGPRSGST